MFLPFQSLLRVIELSVVQPQLPTTEAVPARHQLLCYCFAYMISFNHHSTARKLIIHSLPEKKSYISDSLLLAKSAELANTAARIGIRDPRGSRTLCRLLSCAHALCALSCSAVPPLVCGCSPWCPGIPCLCGPHHDQNGKGPSSSHCFVLTSFRSPRLRGYARCTTARSFLPQLRCRPCPFVPRLSHPSQGPQAGLQHKVLSTGASSKRQLLFRHRVFTVALGKQ